MQDKDGRIIRTFAEFTEEDWTMLREEQHRHDQRINRVLAITALVIGIVGIAINLPLLLKLLTEL